MQLMRRRETWDPFSELEDLSNRFSRLFGMTPWLGNGAREALAKSDWAPSCNISETENEYRLRAELPGVEKQDVHVTMENAVLTIRGERRKEKEEKTTKYHRQELMYGSFVRQFTMPEDADESKVDATFKDGLLNVTVAKSKTKPPKAKEIAVH